MGRHINQPTSIKEDTHFVCISDITNSYVDINTVIFNPEMKSKIDQTRVLHDTILKHFKYDLSENELKHLLSYSRYQTQFFISDIKKILYKNK